MKRTLKSLVAIAGAVLVLSSNVALAEGQFVNNTDTAKELATELLQKLGYQPRNVVVTTSAGTGVVNLFERGMEAIAGSQLGTRYYLLQFDQSVPGFRAPIAVKCGESLSNSAPVKITNPDVRAPGVEISSCMPKLDRGNVFDASVINGQLVITSVN